MQQPQQHSGTAQLMTQSSKINSVPLDSSSTRCPVLPSSLTLPLESLLYPQSYQFCPGVLTTVMEVLCNFSAQPGSLWAQVSTKQLIHTRVAGEQKVWLHSIWTDLNVNREVQVWQTQHNRIMGLLISSLAHGFFSVNFSWFLPEHMVSNNWDTL